jgi:acetyl esterase/lipase
MNARSLELWPEGVPDAVAAGPAECRRPDGFLTHVSRPRLEFYPPPPGLTATPAVIVCPGGGYEALATAHEGVSLAAWLNTLGIAAFVLHYRVPRPGHPAPLRDVLRAMRLVRVRAAELGISPHRIGVLGASAGGHLAACAGTLFDAPEGRTGSLLDVVSARPDFLMLLYPVITFVEECTHAGSRRALLGEKPAADLCEYLSVERQVSRRTPPTFLVHALDDTNVPPDNSRLFFGALQRAGVPATLHLYEAGFHGFGLGHPGSPAAAWPIDGASWLHDRAWRAPRSGLGASAASGGR